ncbi:hypothetical protein H632_c861p0, partial [Helicosporidium sp. ATCC 50920]
MARPRRGTVPSARAPKRKGKDDFFDEEATFMDDVPTHSDQEEAEDEIEEEVEETAAQKRLRL